MSKNDNIDGRALITAARAVRKNAHAPYSGFRVGAAILSSKGRVFVGANVENAAYPEGICAEGAAIAAMVAGGDKKIAAIAIVADPSVTPCGGCRQKLAEFSKPETLVFMSGKSGASMRQEMMESLLPHAFKSVSGR